MRRYCHLLFVGFKVESYLEHVRAIETKLSVHGDTWEVTVTAVADAGAAIRSLKVFKNAHVVYLGSDVEVSLGHMRGLAAGMARSSAVPWIAFDLKLLHQKEVTDLFVASGVTVKLYPVSDVIQLRCPPVHQAASL